MDTPFQIWLDSFYFQISAMIKRLAEEDEKLTENLLNELVSKFAKSNKWVGRQM